ncbi:MAG: Crp/Fnr family transcriptional regulator [Gammaproteobacteria bacterium]|jgi:CRP/FNR family cyclic AMP-dependent transcriptional regulator|nr:Crp/Fnr family transcriptional regulator [Gammaproteobacteria bacterium]
MDNGGSMFGGLSPEDIDGVARHGNAKSFPKGTMLINEGDTSNFMYVILEGRVKVFVSDEKGKEAILNLQGPGELFGELALIDDVPRSASVVTLTPARLAFVSRAEFMSCLSESPDIAMKLLRGMTRRIRELTDLAKNLALNDVYGRVAKTLFRLAKEKEGTLVVEQRLTHQDIADMVGASREMVSRIMKDLTTGGYIRTENRIITIRGKLPPGW